MEKERWLQELAGFIVDGHTKGWAADGSVTSPIFPGMKSVFYNEKDWEYRDNYAGYFRAPGVTVISYKSAPVWSMSYFGQGQTSGYEIIAKPTFQFLRRALMRVTPDLPFRGPPEYSEHEWRYSFRLLRGDIEDFLAEEDVMKDSVVVFRQTVGGGTILGKDEQRRPIYPWTL